MLLLYLYVLWSTIRISMMSTAGAILGRDTETEFSDLIWIWLQPSAMLWLLYALILFTFVIWIARRAPPVLVFVAGLVIFLLFYGDGDIHDNSISEQLAKMFVWMCSGYAFSETSRAFASRVRGIHVLGAILWIAASYWLINGQTYLSSSEYLILAATGIIVGIVVSVLIERSPVRAAFIYLGERTLPIYVSHFIVIQAGVLLRVSDPTAAVFAVVATVALAILFPLALNVLVRRLRIHGIFDLPYPLVNRYPAVTK